MVLAQADVVARVPLGAALTHDDVAGAHGLAAELLHAEALALTVAAVAGRAACLLMCHVELLLLRRFLGRGLSRCSIFCRRRFRRRLVVRLGFGAFGRSVDALCRRIGLGLVLGRGIFGRLRVHLGRRLVGGLGLGRLRRCSSRLRRSLRLGFRLRSGLLLLLVIADRHDLQDRMLLAVALLAPVIVT